VFETVDLSTAFLGTILCRRGRTRIRPARLGFGFVAMLVIALRVGFVQEEL
jgi:hypothetical protein